MFDGFVKVAAVTPKGRVADCAHNRREIVKGLYEALEQGAKIVVFPELCMTGYTCQDLFWQEELILSAKRELTALVHATKGKDALVFVGLPWQALQCGGCHIQWTAFGAGPQEISAQLRGILRGKELCRGDGRGLPGGL